MSDIERTEENQWPKPAASVPPPLPQEPVETLFLKRMLMGPDGVRSGWLCAGFLIVNFAATGVYTVIGARLLGLPLEDLLKGFQPASAGFLEVVSLLALITAMALGALAARRRLLDYNLRSRAWALEFAVGALVGVAALSLLLAALHAGGWIHFSGGDLQGSQIGLFALTWAGIFSLTGLVEEGTSRCYLLGTLTRGINFWWATGCAGLLCLAAAANASGNGTAGVYAAVLPGAVGCMVLYLRRSQSEGFWCAAWLTSVFFCYLHTLNRGESAVGVFGTALIGFTFCVSVRVLGSAWWAIGFHASWDWTQTFLFGTADSGLAPKDHWFSSTPSGPALWSGGSVGPEGSVLLMPLIVLLIAGLAAVAAMRSRSGSSSPPELSSPERSQLS